MKEDKFHEPVLVREIMDILHIENQARVIDATLGTAGHTIEFLKRGANVLGIEADSKLLKLSKRRLSLACPTPNQKGWGSYKLTLGNFINIKNIALDNSFGKVDAVLFDLGISNIHYKNDSRGFSFGKKEAELDMRLNQNTQSVKASDLLNLLRRDQLKEMFGKVMTKTKSKQIADKIIVYRKNKSFKTVLELEKALGGIKFKRSVDKLTLPLMAVRIAVNSELDNLNKALPDAFSILKKDGKLAVISFHSGEDRIVKRFYKKIRAEGKGEILTKKPITAGDEERANNKKSRSAKLRVIKKI